MSAVTFYTVRTTFAAQIFWRLHDLRKEAAFVREFLKLIRSCLRRECNITTLHKFTTDEKICYGIILCKGVLCCARYFMKFCKKG